MRWNFGDPQVKGKGTPSPLGATLLEGGKVNFSLYSQSASSVSLVLYTPEGGEIRYPLAEGEHKTGFVWHISLTSLPVDCLYSYEVDGVIVLDPYAKELGSPWIWGEKKGTPLAKVFPNRSFDWEGDRPPAIPMHKSLIYEMHVRGFTKDPSSQVTTPGTFLGLIEKIPHLKKLGVTAVELLPIYLFDDHAVPPNYWGYNPISFFCPIPSYGSNPSQAIIEFKTMVKRLHAEGIEVILDVVYNHTSSLHAIDKSTYYLLGPSGEHTNYSGCGNTIQANHPVTIRLILDSLRYWADEMHVDGFRFDLASIFCRGAKGEVLENPPIIQAIAEDRTLRRVKLIAEAWDCAGLYQVGTFPRMHRFSEWNGVYRDTVRRFIKGQGNQARLFAKALCGSREMYESPFESINFITAHDGFCLRDLTSYNEKHNEENGENNRDGNDHNDSWNCGVEGETENTEVLELRERQMKNFFLALALSQGTPMLLMGDEVGLTRKGNNNPYGLDNRKNHFVWPSGQEGPLISFVSSLFRYRETHPLFRKKGFYEDGEIQWHGPSPLNPDWSEISHFVAFSLNDPKTKKCYYIAFNSASSPIQVELPNAPTGKKWRSVLGTTHLPQVPIDSTHFSMPPFSSCLLEA